MFHVMKLKVRMNAVSSNDWQEITIYESTSWHFKEDLPTETNGILELVMLIMLGPKIDPENRMRFYRMRSILCRLQRYTTTTTGSGGGHVHHCQTATESSSGNDH